MIKSLKRYIAGIGLACGMTLCMTDFATAQIEISVGDQGFEDHVLAADAGYNYQNAGDGSDEGWASTNGGTTAASPWFDFTANKSGGGNASFMYDSAYNPGAYGDPIGDQAIEVQDGIGQVLDAFFDFGLDYTFTIAATSSTATGDEDFVFRMFDGSGITAASIRADVEANANVVSSIITVDGNDSGFMSDYSFTFLAQDIEAAGLVGQTIGISIEDASPGQGPHVDNIRLTAIPEPGSAALIGLGLAGLLVSRRKQNA